MRIRTLAALVLLCAALGGRAHAQWVGATGDAAGPPPVDYVLDSWRATGEASESICRFTAELKCRILGRGWVAVPFVGSGVSLASLTVSEGEAAKVLVQAKEGKYQLLFGKQGAYTIKIEYVVRLEKREGERSATVPLIPAVTSTTELTLPAESVSYETKPEVKASKSEAGGKTTIIIYGAEVPETTLTWRVKAKVEEGAALAFAEARLDVTATRGLIRVDEEISYSVLRGKLSRMRVSFPADCSLVSVAAEGLRSWDVAPEGAARSALTVDLATPAEKSATLRIALERQVGRVPAEVDIPDVEVMDVRRESGSVLIFGEKEIKVEAGALEGASQVDVREAKVAQAKRPDLAFKYLKRPCRIAVKLSDVEPKVTAEVETHIVAGRERLRATAAIRYQIRDAGVFRLRIQLDAATQLVDVRGENINNWRRNGEVVEVDLRSKAEESYALTVELARAVAAAGLTELPKLQLLGVERETGFIAISPRQDTKVESASVSGIRQVDATELPASLKRGPEAAVSLAYRYVQHPYRVQLSVGKVQPEVHAKVMNTYTLKEKEFILDASVELEVRKAGIFDLRISFPKELRIEGTVREPDRARTPSIEDWDVDRLADQLFLKFRSKIEGSYSFVFTAKGSYDDLLAGVSLPVVGVVGAKKETGYISVRSDEPVRMKVDRAQSSNVSDIDIRELPAKMRAVGGKVDLAFEYYKTPWKLRLDMEEIKPVVSAEVFTLVALGGGRENSSAQIDYTIEQAGVDEFMVQLPQEAENVKWRGPQIKLKEPVKDKPGLWLVALHAEAEDKYSLYVTFERKLGQAATAASQKSAVAYTGVHPQGVSNERGYIAVTPEGNVEIRAVEKKLVDVNVIDVKEVPEKFTRGLTIPVVWSFEYFKSSYSVGLEVVRHEDVAALVTFAEYGKLRTIVSDDGQMLTDLTLLLRNTREPYLRLVLPEGSEVMHAFVAGERVRPGKAVATVDGDDVELKLIPIIGAGKGGELFPAQVIYKHGSGGLGQFGGLRLDCPKVNIPIMRLGWEVTLPREYEMALSYGSLRPAYSLREIGATVDELNKRFTSDRLTQMSSAANVAQGNLLEGQQMRIAPQAGAITGDALKRWEALGAAGAKFFFEKRLALRPSTDVAEFASPGSVRMRYGKRPFRVVFQWLLVILLVVGAWKWRGEEPRRRYGAAIGAALLLMAIAVLNDAAYPFYVNTLMATLWVIVAVMAVVDGWGRFRPAIAGWWERRGSRRSRGTRYYDVPPEIKEKAGAREDEGRGTGWVPVDGEPEAPPGESGEPGKPEGEAGEGESHD